MLSQEKDVRKKAVSHHLRTYVCVCLCMYAHMHSYMCINIFIYLLKTFELVEN